MCSWRAFWAAASLLLETDNDRRGAVIARAPGIRAIPTLDLIWRRAGVPHAVHVRTIPTLGRTLDGTVFKKWFAGPTLPMDALRLGLIGLSSAEDSLIATLFRLHRVDPSFIWALATQPPYDALLVDSACKANEFEHLMGLDTKLMRLGPIGSEEPGELARPIRSDYLIRWLNTIEVEILHSSGDQFASTGIQSRHSRSWLDSDAGTGRRQPVIVEGQNERPHSHALPDGGRFKLLRWPTGPLLSGDVNRIRMATMLSRRSLTVQDLNATTQVADGACKVFLQELHDAGLLEVVTPNPTSEAAGVAQVDAKTQGGMAPLPEAKARGVGRSLLRSIRKRFGI